MSDRLRRCEASLDLETGKTNFLFQDIRCSADADAGADTSAGAGAEAEASLGTSRNRVMMMQSLKSIRILLEIYNAARDRTSNGRRVLGISLQLVE